jgi:hypothetical protein
MRTVCFLSLIAPLVLLASGTVAQPAKTDPKTKTDPKGKTDKTPKGDEKFNLKITIKDVRLGTALTGPNLKADDLKAHAVLVDEWGIHCPPCLAAMPHTADLYAELADFGLIIIGSHRQDGTAETVKSVAIAHRANFPIYVNTSVRGTEDNNGLPHCLLFDHSGQCVFRGLPTQVEALVRKEVGAALVAAAGREKWSPKFEPIVKDLRAGKPPGTLLAKIASQWTSAGDVGEDATALLAAMTAVGTKKLEEAKAKKESDPVEAYFLIEKVPTTFKDTPLASEASQLLGKLKADKAVKAELAARPALEAVRRVETQLAVGNDDPKKADWQKAHKEPLTDLKKKIQSMKTKWPDTRATQDALAIAERFGVEIK